MTHEQATNEATKVLRAEPFFRKLDRKSQHMLTKDLKNTVGELSIPKKAPTATQKKMMAVAGKKPAKKVSVDPVKELRRSLKQREKAYKEGQITQKKRVAETKKQLKEVLKSMAKEIRESGLTTTKTLLEKVAGINENNFDSTVDYIMDVVGKAAKRKDIKAAKSAQAKVKKALKNLPKELKGVGENLLKINPKFLDNPSELAEVADTYTSIVKGRGGDMESVIESIKKLEENQKKGIEAEKERLAREAYDNSELKNEMSFEDFKDLAYNPDSSGELTNDQKLEEEGKVKEKSKARQRLEKIVAAGIENLKAKLENETDLTPEQRRTLKTLTGEGVEIENMSTSELKVLNNVVNEISLFNSYNRSGEIETIIEGKQTAKDIRSEFEGKINFPGFAKWKGAQSLLSVPNYLKAIVGGKLGKTLARKLFGELNRNYNIALGKSDKFNQKLDNLYRKLKNKQESFTKMGMVSFLAQHESGSSKADIEQDFIAKKNYIELQIKKIRDVVSKPMKDPHRKRSLEKVLKQQEEVYEKYFADANSKEEALAKLTPEEV
jgi:hypothetical protein